MSVDAGEVLFRLAAQDAASAPLKAVQSALGNLGKAAGAQTTAVGGIGKAIGGLGSVASAPIRALGGLVGALGQVGLAGLGIQTLIGTVGALGSVLSSGPIGAASDLAESMSKVDVVFGESAQGIKDWANTAARSMGQSKGQAIAAAGAFGNLFVSMGLGQGEASDLSQGIVELGADLASFNNIDSAIALDKLRAGLVGETEPLRALGVNMNAAMVEAEGMALGLEMVDGKLTESAKVQARYSLILKQTKTAQGDFARTSTGLANAQRIIGASFEDLSASIGGRLLPVIAPLVSAFATGLPGAMDTFFGVLDQVGAFLDPLISSLGSALPGALSAVGAAVSAVITPIRQLFTYLSADNDFDLMRSWFGPNIGPLIDGVVRSFKSLIEPILAVGAAIGGLISGDLNLGEFLGEMLAALLDHLGNLANIAVSIGELAVGLGAAFIEMVGNIDWAGVGATLLSGLQGALAFLVDAASTAGTAVLDFGTMILGSIASVDWPAVGLALLGGLTGALSLLGKTASEAGKGLIDLGGIVLGAIASVDWPAVGKSLLDGLTGAIEGAGDVVAAVATWVGAQFSGIDWGGVWGTVTEIGQGLLDGLGDIGDGLVGWVTDQWATLADKWSGIWAGAGNIVMGLLASVADFGGAVVTWVTEAWAFLKDKWPTIWAGAGNIVMGLLASVVDFGGSVVTWVTEAWAFLVDKWPGIWAGAGDIVGGLIASVTDLGAQLATWIGAEVALIDWTAIWQQAQDIGIGLVSGLGEAAAFLEDWLTIQWNAVNWGTVFGSVDATGFTESFNAWTREALVKAVITWPTDMATAINGVDFSPVGAAIVNVLGAPFALIGLGIRTLTAQILGSPEASVQIGDSWANGLIIALLGIPGRIYDTLNQVRLEIIRGMVERFGELINIDLIAEIEKINWASVGLSMLSGLVGGITANVGLAVDAGKRLANLLIDTVKGILGIGSPSRVFIAIGEDIVAGLVQGVAGLPAALADILATLTKWLADTALAVFAGAITIGQDMVEGFVNGTVALGDELATILGIITDWIVEAAAAILTGAVAMGTSLIDGFVDGLAGLAGALSGAIQSAFANIDIDFGIFHLHDGVITIDMPSISLPSIGGGDTSGSSQAQAVPTGGNSAQGQSSSQSSQSNSVTINYSPTTSARLDPVADYRVLMSISGVA